MTSGGEPAGIIIPGEIARIRPIVARFGGPVRGADVGPEKLVLGGAFRLPARKDPDCDKPDCDKPGVEEGLDDGALLGGDVEESGPTRNDPEGDAELGVFAGPIGAGGGGGAGVAMRFGPSAPCMPCGTVTALKLLVEARRSAADVPGSPTKCSAANSSERICGT